MRRLVNTIGVAGEVRILMIMMFGSSQTPSFTTQKIQSDLTQKALSAIADRLHLPLIHSEPKPFS